MLGNFRWGNRTFVYTANGDVIAANEGIYAAKDHELHYPYH